MFENSSITSAITSVYKTLNTQIINQYPEKENKENLVDKLLNIHGISRSHFSIIDRMESFIESNINVNSIDDNSNKNEKTIKGIMQEAKYPLDKLIGYRYLYRKMKQIYGKKEAKKLSGLLYDYTLALSDSTNILLPYCWSFDASKIITMGKPFGQLYSTPVKRIDSYFSVLNEIIHQMSNHLAGAIAIGSFFLDIAHLLLLKENKAIEDLKIKEYRNHLGNQFQKFIYGVNSLSRGGGTESPFTNVSLFDRVKLAKLVEEYNWYFVDEKTLESKYSKDYIVEFIIELQNIYMEFFDKGDPSKGGMPYRFPVSTLNISKKKNKEGKSIVEDKKFLSSVCKKDIYRYNVFVSEGEKVATCCRLLSDAEMLELASQANSFGAGGSISLGSHRVLTINFVRLALLATSYEHFKQLLTEQIYNTKKILFAHKELLKDMSANHLFIKIGWIQLNRMFSTVGIIGYIEAEDIILKNFKKEVSNLEDIMYDFLTFLNQEVNSNNEEFIGCIFNIEQIPGESMCHRLARADKLFFGEEKVPYNIYSNQLTSLWNRDTTIWERMIKSGKFNKTLTGGGIDHINTGEHITSKQAENIINFAVESDCEHFAITGTFCICEDNHLAIGNTFLCQKCGKPIISKIARTVGFFTPVEDWNPYKQEYDLPLRKEFKNGDFNYVE